MKEGFAERNICAKKSQVKQQQSSQASCVNINQLWKHKIPYTTDFFEF